MQSRLARTAAAVLLASGLALSGAAPAHAQDGSTQSTQSTQSLSSDSTSSTALGVSIVGAVVLLNVASWGYTFFATNPQVLDDLIAAYLPR